MWLRMGVILLAVGFQVPFAAKSPESLRQRYGQPISETFLVRPGIVVSATYGTSGNICELVISPRRMEPDPNNKMMKRWPGSDPINDDVLREIAEELVPKSEWGKYIMPTFIDGICMPQNDCAGVEEDYQNVAIFRSNAGVNGASRYETIRWKRTECSQN